MMVYKPALRLAALLALAATPAARAQAPAVAIDAPASALARVAIVVADPAKALRFYTYALGYRVTFDGVIDRPGLREMLGLKPTQSVRFIVLANGRPIGGEHREGAMIGLLTVSKPALPVPRVGRENRMFVGQAMLAVRTEDIATVHRRLIEIGATILAPPVRSADGAETELVVLDPDGTRIHVVERHAR